MVSSLGLGRLLSVPIRAYLVLAGASGQWVQKDKRCVLALRRLASTNTRAHIRPGEQGWASRDADNHRGRTRKRASFPMPITMSGRLLTGRPCRERTAASASAGIV